MTSVLERRCQCSGYGLGYYYLREIEVVVCGAVEGNVEENEQVLADSKKAVEQFTTLNQALKAWPALAKLCPPEKISKVHEKQQRKRKEAENRAKIIPIENEINQTILTASLLED